MGVDLAIGLFCSPPARWPLRPAARPAEGGSAATGGGQPERPGREKKDGWARRVLAQPRLGLAMPADALIGIPGAGCLNALHKLITGKSPAATQVAAVVVVLIEFALISIPFVFLELRPEATRTALTHAQAWLLAHARQLMAYTALILGACLAVSGRPVTAELTW